jgi:CRISPR-associated protein Cmr2
MEKRPHLFAISIGPVQGFIAAARRTRDFWMGSAILSEVAKAVARAVVQADTAEGSPPDLSKLVFPAPTEWDDLAPIAFDADDRELKTRFDVTNVILSVLEATPADLQKRADALHDVAQEAWRRIARAAATRCAGELRADWDAQLRDDLIEFYAAWVPLEDGQDGYANSRRAVMRLLGARKACRNFQPWRGEPGLPKSSLDANRETVLLEPDGSARRRRRLRIKPQEQLDLVGVMKRAEWGHDSIRYPSVSRVAVDPWVRGVVAAGRTNEETARLFQQLRECCEALQNAGVLRRRKSANPKRVENDLDKFPWLTSFPFEGTPLYAARHQEILRELQQEAVGDDSAADSEQVVQRHLAELRQAAKQLADVHPFTNPWAYAAVFVADGDRMGATLSEIARLPDGLNKHREFSRRQSEFAVRARGIVNGDFSGACFYAGADDILGMVAVDQALACARKLHDLFHQMLGGWTAQWGIAAPTLSVGMAVGHFMEPLEDLLHHAREAERRAKSPSEAERSRGQKDRNALAIAIHPRGGASCTVRGNWAASDSPDSIDARVLTWARLHRERQLPTKAAYDLKLLAGQYERPWKDSASLAEAVRRDAMRVLGRKRPARGDSSDAAKNEVRRLIEAVATASDLMALADEMIAGQWIGDALDQAVGTRWRHRKAQLAGTAQEATG